MFKIFKNSKFRKALAATGIISLLGMAFCHRMDVFFPIVIRPGKLLDCKNLFYQEIQGPLKDLNHHFESFMRRIYENKSLLRVDVADGVKALRYEYRVFSFYYDNPK